MTLPLIRSENRISETIDISRLVERHDRLGYRNQIDHHGGMRYPCTGGTTNRTGLILKCLSGIIIKGWLTFNHAGIVVFARPASSLDTVLYDIDAGNFLQAISYDYELSEFFYLPTIS